MLENWTHAVFSQNLNTTFAVQHPQWGRVTVKLVEVSDLRETPHQSMFSLVFLGKLNQPLEQGMHSMTHPVMGTEELFLVPIGREPDGFRYEAIFNHLIK